jgi:two-component system sensor histidine kinase ChvG
VTRWLRPPEPPPEPGDYYEKSPRLLGTEVREALAGSVSTAKRASPHGHRSLILYVAVPMRTSAGVQGAVLVSESTYPILQDLYAVRLGILRIVMLSVAMAVALSLYVTATIVAPLRRLRMEARSILDRTGRLRGRFAGSKRRDEIGELSRALERLTRRLDVHLRFVETFASDVAHEFKNPLASIRTAAEMLADVDEPEQRQRFHAMVNKEIARLEKLLSGVREITMLDAAIAREPFTIVALPDLLTQIVEGFRLRMRSRVTYELALEAEGNVRGSSERLAQAFENILDNAASFTPDGGTIRLSLQREGASLVIRCDDEGPGIPESHIARVFDRFFSYRPEEGRAGHTGLGLSIVKTVIEAHGGRVNATNRSEGGTRFEIVLPAA